MSDNLLVLDVDKLSSDVQNGLETGEYRISRIGGIVRDLSGKIVEHIPHKTIQCSQQDMQNLPQFIKSVQGTMVATTAISSAAILGAVVVATTIIVNKLNEIQDSLDDIKKELQDQNLFQYFLQLKEYVAVSESLREILTSPECIEENRDIIIMKLNDISIQRNGLILTMNERLKNIDNVSTRHKEVIVNFLDQSVALLPKIAYIEYEGANAIGKFRLADSINAEFSKKYKTIEFRYKQFLNEEINKSIKGESNLPSSTIENIKKSAELEFNLNRYLLLKENS